MTDLSGAPPKFCPYCAKEMRHLHMEPTGVWRTNDYAHNEYHWGYEYTCPKCKGTLRTTVE